MSQEYSKPSNREYRGICESKNGWGELDPP